MKYHDTKSALADTIGVGGDEAFGQQTISEQKAGTAHDQKDMARVGKSQELRVKNTSELCRIESIQNAG